MKKVIKVHEDLWTIRVLTSKRYEKLHGEDSLAITDTEIKCIDFKKGEISLSTIIHECTHLYYFYAPVGTMTHTTVGDWEEIFAEFNAKFLHKLNILSLELYIFLCGASLKPITRRILKNHIKTERKLSKLCDLSLE